MTGGRWVHIIIVEFSPFTQRFGSVTLLEDLIQKAFRLIVYHYFTSGRLTNPTETTKITL